MNRRPPRSALQDAPICCSRRMVLRFGPGGTSFYGCAMFPLCRRTERANVVEPQWFKKGGAK